MAETVHFAEASDRQRDSSSVEERLEISTPDGFSVYNDETGNWVIRKIVECRDYAKHCAEWCDREQARAKHDEEFLLFRYGPQLIEYARQKIAAAGGRRKSVALPGGTVGFRSEAAKLVVDDEASVIAWAKEHCPTLVSTVEKLSKSGLNDHLQKTGELPTSGTHIEPAREKFFVK